MSFPVLNQSAARLTQAIFYGRVSVGAVPSTRAINTNAPLTGGGNLSADLTLGLTTTPPSGTVAVGSLRNLTATLPLTVNASATASLATDVAFAINTFGSAFSGIVPASGGGTTNFLCANGSWLPVAGGAGVPLTRLINTTAPLAGGGDLSADRTLSVTVANITTNGVVPATGGTDPTKFLCMTNPISWVAVPNVGAVVRLQASSPGTADVGNFHISGIGMADSELVAGDALGSFGSGEQLYVNQTNFNNPPLIASWNTGSAITPGFRFLAARGTRGSPSNLNTNDEVLLLKHYLPISAAYGDYPFLEGYVDGAIASGAYPLSLKLRAIPSAGVNEPFIRLKGSTGYAGIMTDTPSSGWEIGKSFGRAKTNLTAVGPTVLDDTYPSVILCDCTANNVQAQLPPPAGRTGRQYTFVKVDSTANNFSVIPNVSELIGGHPITYLWAQSQSITVTCDGTNWWISDSYKWRAQSTQLADSSTLSNSVVNTKLYGSFVFNNDLPGAVFGLRAMGKFSTTGTPTLDIQIQNGGTNVIADSTAITTPSGVTNAVFQVDCEWLVRSVAGGITSTIRPTKGVLSLSNNSNVISTYNMALLAPPTIAARVDTLNLFAQWGTPSSSNSVTLIGFETYGDPASVIS